MSETQDPIGLFDPLLSAVSPRGDHAHFKGGYKIWPNGARVKCADIRMLAMGNSTSLWPDAAWSLQLAKRLGNPGREVAVFNGAGKGNTSSQEVLRLLRDAPAIQPDIVLSLSGICDIGFLLNAKGYPFLHKYTRRVLNYLKANDVCDDVANGIRDGSSPAEVWCRNQRMAKALSDELGLSFVVFLQPVQGVGNYPQTAEEKAYFEQKSQVVLKSINKPYGICVAEFYQEVTEIMAARPRDFSHVVDLTRVFDDCPGAYRDHRHQSPLGVSRLVDVMQPYVEQLIAGIELSRHGGKVQQYNDRQDNKGA